MCVSMQIVSVSRVTVLVKLSNCFASKQMSCCPQQYKSKLNTSGLQLSFIIIILIGVFLKISKVPIQPYACAIVNIVQSKFYKHQSKKMLNA